MRKALSRWLVILAQFIYKHEAVKNMLKTDIYEPKQIAFATSYTKKDLRRKCRNERLSRRKAKSDIINECKELNAKVVFGTAKKLLSHRIFDEGNETVIETRLNVYVRKKEGKCS